MGSGRPWPACGADAWAVTSACAAAVAEVTGPLDAAELRRRVTAAVARHTALLTTVETDPGGPARRSAEDVTPVVTTVDLLDVPEGERAQRAADLEHQTATEPLTAAGPGRMRFTLIRTAPGRHLLVAAVHRALADPASVRALLADIAAGAERNDAFAEWAAAQAAAEVTPQGRARTGWWEERLAGIALPPPPDFTAARSTPPAEAPCQVAARVAAATGHDATAVLLAAWAVVQARHGGGPEIVVGVPLAGRTDPAQVGPYEADTAVRISLAGDPSFGDLLARTATALAEAREHGPVPARVLRAAGGGHRPPLLPIRFVAGDARTDEEHTGADGTAWRIRDAREAGTAARATLRVEAGAEAGAGAGTVRVEYGAAEPADRMARMLGHLRVLLDAAAAGPGAPALGLPMLTADELADLEAWNDTAAEYPRDRCVHTLFEEQAELHPFSVALTAEGEHLTYRELDRRANRLAHLLQERGVGPETLVGIVATRTTATLVAMMATLKAGGAYVPLDPGYPPARLKLIGDDARLHVVVGDPEFHETMPRGALPSISVADAAGHPDTRPVCAATPRNLAYVIYTSGSTGRPKGVLVPHRQIVHSTAARWADGRFSPGSYAPPVPLSFDASCAAIYWSLCRGGRLVLPTDAEARDPRLFAKLVKDENVSHVTGMPSFYALVLTAGKRALQTLRDASIGGEAMAPDVAAEHCRTLPLARLYNDYGPTECTVWSTAHRCEGDERGGSVPIGRPIQNVRVHLLDERLERVPVGVTGQICIAGEGLARGYLGDPAATAARFVPDPYGPRGSRMYLTGDLGVRLPDGELRFVGRLDAQVKVRGFRVELTEVEAALQEHPAVVTAAVALDTSETRLTGHVVARDPRQPPDQEELRGFLRGRLPEYMIPDRIESRTSIPVTPHGKVDRQALAATNPGHGRTPSAEPRTDAGLQRYLGALSEDGLDAVLAGLLDKAEPRTEGRPR